MIILLDYEKRKKIRELDKLKQVRPRYEEDTISDGTELNYNFTPRRYTIYNDTIRDQIRTLDINMVNHSALPRH